MPHLLIACLAAFSAEAPPAPLATPTAGALLEGFFASRAGLRSGEFDGEGSRVVEKRGEKTTCYNLRSNTWFDAPAGLWRFDQVEQIPMHFGPPDRPKPTVEPVELAHKYVLRRDTSIVWSRMYNYVGFYPREHPPFLVRTMDVRRAGLDTFGDFLSGYKLGEGEDFDAMARDYAQKFREVGTVVSRPAAGLLRLEWRANGMLYRVTFDANSGLPVAFVAGDFCEFHKVLRWVPVTESTTSWGTSNGVRVPEAVTHLSRLMNNAHTTFQLRYTWRGVNMPVRPETFTLRGMAPPRGTPVCHYPDPYKAPTRLGQIGDEPPHAKVTQLDTPRPQP